MLEFFHHYSHDSKWFLELAKKSGAKLIDDTIAVLPKKLGHGEFYFTNIMPGVSIVLMDVLFKEDVLYNRLISEEDLYILQFDLSDDINEFEVNNVEANGLLLYKSGFSVVSSQIENSFKPVAGKRTYALRLLVDKSILNECVKKTYWRNKVEGINCVNENFLVHDYMDSKSKVLIHCLKNKSVFDTGFDLFFKGTALKLLANFMDNYTVDRFDEVFVNDSDCILKTKNYLLGNLYGLFPTISFLANMAGVSVTKYKLLFNKMYGITPNQFFIMKKLMLAETLLKSGEFSSVNKVAELLNYSKSQYFSTRYMEFFGRKPSVDLVKKNR